LDARHLCTEHFENIFDLHLSIERSLAEMRSRV
jgi:hypothetical protein